MRTLYFSKVTDYEIGDGRETVCCNNKILDERIKIGHYFFE